MNAEMKALIERLDRMEAENSKLREQLKARPAKLARSKLFLNGPSANPKAPSHSGTLDLPDGSAWHAVAWQQEDGSLVLRFQTEEAHLAERVAWKAAQR